MNNDSYNPDVLSCLANLSNDEVFTPPNIVEEMLSLLPDELWSDENATFLDPFTKSGVFLREIAKRLIKGLSNKIPNLQDRLDHIFQKQLYGIAITELTSLLSRRSLYCSKYPNCKFSVSLFDNVDGNIRYKRFEHTWKGNKCIWCGAPKNKYDRGPKYESHAYEFIHTEKPERILNMKFDVIIGNPPYHLSDGGGVGSSAVPIYNLFVEQAKKLNPRYLCMITPSRWMLGGRELEDFRKTMLNDDRIRVIHDYYNASECFPGVDIKGGVSYFLWDRDHPGLCNITIHRSNGVVNPSTRPLLEPGMEYYIRDAKHIPILKKVRALKEKPFSSIISSNDPFGFDVRVAGSMKRVKPDYSLEKRNQDDVFFYYFGWRRKGVGYISPISVGRGSDKINTYKIFIPKAWGKGEAETDCLNPFIPEKGSVCTETYLSIGPFENANECQNVVSYIKTKFFHFMVSQLKITQNSMQDVYNLVPVQDWSEKWTDEKLYAKYNLSVEEIELINQLIPDKVTILSEEE